MGRPRLKDRDLPERMRRNHGAFYHVHGGVWRPLGKDKAAALIKWAEIEGTPAPASSGTLQAVWTFYATHPNGLRARAARTQRDYEKDSKKILAVFGRMQVAAITPAQVRRYLDNRVGKDGKPAHIRATREKALLSLLCTFARSEGVYHGANPCEGIKGWKSKRTRYATDQELAAVSAVAIESAQDALQIALATGQRPADVRKMRLPDIRDGVLWVEQNKTKQRLGVRIEGPLKIAIDRSRARADAAKVTTMHLLTDMTGKPYNAWTLRLHIRTAAKLAGVADFQLRDMRSKAATDLDDLAAAQKLLGHKTRAQTEDYVKGRRGDVVAPFAQSKRQ